MLKTNTFDLDTKEVVGIPSEEMDTRTVSRRSGMSSDTRSFKVGAFVEANLLVAKLKDALVWQMVTSTSKKKKEEKM